MNINNISNTYKMSSPYSVILCDLWGVVHNGIKLHEQAIKTLEEIEKAKKDYVLLTNAFYGESTDGNWTVRVLDGCGTGSPFGSRSSKLEDWSIRFFEH